MLLFGENMRTKEEVENFIFLHKMKFVYGCKICKGKNPNCKCSIRHKIAVEAYESCIPQDFWWINDDDIDHNKDIFENTVKVYVKNINKALNGGYGLLFIGDNGVGKTYFISYVLMEAIKKGRSTYFTTMPDLDYNIKRGFKDQAIERRLRLMLTSDFLAIDELGKERSKSNNDYMDSQIERIIKGRLDDNQPMLLATNMDLETLEKAYGPTVSSILLGKFQAIMMEPGDYRARLRDRMVREMGYE